MTGSIPIRHPRPPNTLQPCGLYMPCQPDMPRLRRQITKMTKYNKATRGMLLDPGQRARRKK